MQRRLGQGITPQADQRGFVLILGLIMLAVITVLVVNTLSGGIVQGKLASSLDIQTRGFAGAEVAIEGVLFEANDTTLVQAADDVLSEARQGDPLERDKFLCFDTDPGDGIDYTPRQFTQPVLTAGVKNDGSGTLATVDDQAGSDAQLSSWAVTAFDGEQPCAGSSVVLGGTLVSCHQFVVRGCGRVTGSTTTAANSLGVEVLAPSTAQ